MPTRSAKADWQGEFKRGGGSVSTETGVLDAPYNFSGRFESGSGTNPEELIAAAHASCFTMALSVGLTQAGHPPEKLETSAAVTVEQVEGGFGITKIALSLTGKVPGMDAAELRGGRERRQGRLPRLEGARERPRDHVGDDLRGVARIATRTRRSRPAGHFRQRRRRRSREAHRPSTR